MLVYAEISIRQKPALVSVSYSAQCVLVQRQTYLNCVLQGCVWLTQHSKAARHLLARRLKQAFPCHEVHIGAVQKTLLQDMV